MQADEKPLDKMTAPELREIAKEIPGVSGVHAMKKEELLVIIKEFKGIKDEEPTRKKTRKTGKISATPRELKLRIARLREEKELARESKDTRRIHILRRRINRLKKLTRKVAQA
ncbi:MAG: transcription termination factor Rho [Deltaproteobacteria bacterium]|nr:MAG: transcription termination factor Rho [Deltaproteobacteria bacterium]